MPELFRPSRGWDNSLNGGEFGLYRPEGLVYLHHVDAGYHVVGMKHSDAPDISLAKY